MKSFHHAQMAGYGPEEHGDYRIALMVLSRFGSELLVARIQKDEKSWFIGLAPNSANPINQGEIKGAGSYKQYRFSLHSMLAFEPSHTARVLKARLD